MMYIIRTIKFVEGLEKIVFQLVQLTSETGMLNLTAA